MTNDAIMFTATPYDTAAEKARFYDQYRRWVARGCPASSFTRPFYRRLSQMFGHIAHYNADGFYGTWCETPAKRADLLTYHQRGGVYGIWDSRNDAHTFSDVERAIAEWLQGEGAQYVQREQDQAEQETRDRELRMLAALKAKYGGAEE